MNTVPSMTPEQVQRFWQKVDKSAGSDACWMWMGSRNNKGYGCQSVYKRGLLAHRIAWRLTYGTIPAGQLLCHRCDNPACCNPLHLFLGTQKENMQDCAKKGRTTAGETAHHAKLTWDQVHEMRQLYRDGWKQKDLVARYDVYDESTISKILRGEVWHDDTCTSWQDQRVKLTWQVACEIRQLSMQGWQQRAIAKHYGISQSTVSKIVRGERWRNDVKERAS